MFSIHKFKKPCVFKGVRSIVSKTCVLRWLSFQSVKHILFCSGSRSQIQKLTFRSVFRSILIFANTICFAKVSGSAERKHSFCTFSFGREERRRTKDPKDHTLCSLRCKLVSGTPQTCDCVPVDCSIPLKYRYNTLVNVVLPRIQHSRCSDRCVNNVSRSR